MTYSFRHVREAWWPRRKERPDPYCPVAALNDQIVAGRLYMQDVERDVAGIEQVVEALSGRRPRPARQ